MKLSHRISDAALAASVAEKHGFAMFFYSQINTNGEMFK